MKNLNYITLILAVVFTSIFSSCNNTDEVAPVPPKVEGIYTVSDFEGSWDVVKAARDGDTILSTSPYKCDSLEWGFGNLIVDLSIQYLEWNLHYSCRNNSQSQLQMIVDNQNIISVIEAGRTLLRYKILETTDITSDPKRLDIVCIENTTTGFDVLGITYFFEQ